MPSNSESGGFLRKLDEGFRAAGIAPSQSIICAVSGGPDSTALVLGARQLRRRYGNLVVAHFNHLARGQQSDGDEEFVRQLCIQNEIPLHVGRAGRITPTLDENTARQERYAFLTEIADAMDADVIVLAHTVEDQAETVLLRISRGAGIRGAAGMRPSRPITTTSGRDVNVARPMLDINRTEVVEFLDSALVVARHDSSNDDWKRYARNRIRHRVMPELRALNPNVTNAISRFSEIMSSNVDFVEALADEVIKTASTNEPNALVRRHVAALHPFLQAEILRRLYGSIASPDSQLDQDHIVKLLTLISQGKSSRYHLPGGVYFQSDHQHFSVYRGNDSPPDLSPYPGPLSGTKVLPIPGSVDIGDGYSIEGAVSPPATDFNSDAACEAWLNPEIAISGRLEVRNRRAADSFNPLGMCQEVNLNEFLINAKIPASWRDGIPLVVSPSDGRIAWLPGIRPSEWAKLRSDHELALHLRMILDHSEDTIPDGVNP